MKGARLVPEELAAPEKAPCRGCGWPLRLDIGTDGHGRLVETAEECRYCRPSAFVVVPKGHMVRTCAECGAGFAVPRRRGRPRTRCPRCR